jgi:hypothetical protein
VDFALRQQFVPGEHAGQKPVPAGTTLSGQKQHMIPTAILKEA